MKRTSVVFILALSASSAFGQLQTAGTDCQELGVAVESEEECKFRMLQGLEWGARAMITPEELDEHMVSADAAVALLDAAEEQELGLGDIGLDATTYPEVFIEEIDVSDNPEDAGETVLFVYR